MKTQAQIIHEMLNRGTPKCLDEAIEWAMCVGTLNGMRERIRLSVRDYMAQEFQKTMLDPEVSDETGKRLKEIFERVLR